VLLLVGVDLCYWGFEQEGLGLGCELAVVSTGQKLVLNHPHRVYSA